MRAASRSCSRRCRRPSRRGSASASRSRRSVSAPGPNAKARCSYSTTSWASTKDAPPASPSATPTSPQRSAPPWSASRATSALAPSPPRSTPTRCPRKSWPRSGLPARDRDHERKREDEEREPGERDRDHGSQRAPALDHRDPVDEEPERPEGEQARGGVEEQRPGPVVVAARPERVTAVDDEPQRPDEHEPEHHRRRRECQHVARPPVARLRARSAQADVEERSGEPVRGDAVDRAGEEDEDGEDGEALVDEPLVEPPPGLRREQDPGDPGEDDERQHGLLTRLDLGLRLVAKRREDRPRRLEDRQRAQPPSLLGALLRRRVGVRAHELQANPRARAPPPRERPSNTVLLGTWRAPAGRSREEWPYAAAAAALGRSSRR